MDDKQLTWLMEGDPSVRYQTRRDLLPSSPEDTEGERKSILTEGWGKELFDRQDEEGTWSSSLYSPKWISTFYSLLLLFRFGAPPHPRLKKAAMILLDRGFYEMDGGINYWKTWKQGECCVTGMLLSMLCHFEIRDSRMEAMVRYLLDQQMDDGGWNCERYRGAVHSSFHTTISVLEGLYEFEKQFPESGIAGAVRQKQSEGIEFLLKHSLYRSSTTGEIVNPFMAKLSFPPRWHYDILRCLDYFQSKNVPYDGRMEDALNLLTSRRTADGFWKLEKKYTGKLFFQMEKVGYPSRWNTLRALRVLKWREGG